MAALRTLVAAAAVLVLAVGVAPAAAARAGLSGANPFELCVTYNATECLQHADKCVACHAWKKVNMCLELEVAAKLPPKFFSCDFPPPPEPPVEPPAEPANTDCQIREDEKSCTDTENCVWCFSAAVPSACYSTEEAKRLPPAVFKCLDGTRVAEQ